MAKIHELLGLDESGMAVKAQNPPAEKAKNDGDGANPTPGSSSSAKNDGGELKDYSHVLNDRYVGQAQDVISGGTDEVRTKDGMTHPATQHVTGRLTSVQKPANDNELAHKLYEVKTAEDKQNRVAQSQKKRLTYAEMVDQLYPEQAEARRAAEDARDAKKRRREAVITALGDGLTTIANLGSVIGGANPVSYETMSERSQARWDKIKADKDARRDAYRAARIRAAQADQEREDALAAAERAAKQRDEDNAREDAKWLAQLNYNRERDGLNRESREAIAAGNWATRRYTADKSYDGRVYATNHKKSGGGSGSARYAIPIPDENGNLRYIPVTGNKYADYMIDLNGLGNSTHTEEDDGLGGKKNKYTTTNNLNKQKNAQKVREELAKRKQKSGKGGGNHPKVKI